MGEGGVKNLKKEVTYFVNGPIVKLPKYNAKTTLIISIKGDLEKLWILLGLGECFFMTWRSTNRDFVSVNSLYTYYVLTNKPRKSLARSRLFCQFICPYLNRRPTTNWVYFFLHFLKRRVVCQKTAFFVQIVKKFCCRSIVKVNKTFFYF